MLRTIAPRRDEDGFTLIELLVVMIIIGILAAIAIPVFLSQRAKARDTAVKADVSTLGKEIATYFVDNGTAPGVAITSGRYVIGTTDAGKASNGVGVVTTYTGTAVSTTGTLSTTGWTAAAWCVALHDPNGSSKTFRYSAQNGLEQGQCKSATLPV